MPGSGFCPWPIFHAWVTMVRKKWLGSYYSTYWCYIHQTYINCSSWHDLLMPHGGLCLWPTFHASMTKTQNGNGGAPVIVPITIMSSLAFVFKITKGASLVYTNLHFLRSAIGISILLLSDLALSSATHFGTSTTTLYPFFGGSFIASHRISSRSRRLLNLTIMLGLLEFLPPGRRWHAWNCMSSNRSVGAFNTSRKKSVTFCSVTLPFSCVDPSMPLTITFHLRPHISSLVLSWFAESVRWLIAVRVTSFWKYVQNT